MTLVEILCALVIITIPLVAMLGSFPVALQGVESGRQQSTAIFLAEQRLEQIRAWNVNLVAGQGFSTIANGTPSTAACCAAEGYNTIGGYGTYRRQVIVADGPTSTTKLIRAQVFYLPIVSNGVGPSEARVELSTMISSR